MRGFTKGLPVSRDYPIPGGLEFRHQKCIKHRNACKPPMTAGSCAKNHPGPNPECPPMTAGHAHHQLTKDPPPHLTLSDPHDGRVIHTNKAPATNHQDFPPDDGRVMRTKNDPPCALP